MAPARLFVTAVWSSAIAALANPTSSALTAAAEPVPMHEALNAMMATGENGMAPKPPIGGVLMRSMFDEFVNLTQVVVASLIHNSVHAPNCFRPTLGPNGIMCPNNGSTGYGPAQRCYPDENNETGPWNYPQIGVLVGSKIQDFFRDGTNLWSTGYDSGVFYASAANSLGKRCRYIEKYKGYDCPGHWITDAGEVWEANEMSGAGQFAPGNPEKNATWGGGAGCHFADYNPKQGLDQTDAIDFQGRNFVTGKNCKCNTAMKFGAKPWDQWVDQWLKYAKPKASSSFQAWFTKGKAPSTALEYAACWMTNPRDMVELQNSIWRHAWSWSNQLIPASNWVFNAASQRSYWGWNEVPVSVEIHNPKWWDVVAIKLPLAICGNEGNDDSLQCLSPGAQKLLNNALFRYVAAGYLKVGLEFANMQPGSSVLLLKEYRVNGDYWQRRFFCEDWVATGGKFNFKIVKNSSSTSRGGGCYLDNAETAAVPVRTVLI